MEEPALVPVFSGPLQDAFIARATLQARGIDAFIPDEIIKTMDPFVTGANCLDVVLLCPADRRAEAREILGARGGMPVESPEGERSDLEPPALEALGRRVRWAVLCMVTLPIGAVLGAIYLSRARRARAAPRHHGMTVLASWFALAAMLFAVAYAVGRTH